MATSTLPKVGDKVAFLLRGMDPPEWVAAEVIEYKDGAGEVVEPYDQLGDSEEVLHLKVALNRKRHHAGSNFGIRLNVVKGDKPGQWLPKPPENADEVYADGVREKQIREKIGRERARGQG